MTRVQKFSARLFDLPGYTAIEAYTAYDSGIQPDLFGYTRPPTMRLYVYYPTQFHGILPDGLFRSFCRAAHRAGFKFSDTYGYDGKVRCQISGKGRHVFIVTLDPDSERSAGGLGDLDEAVTALLT